MPLKITGKQRNWKSLPVGGVETCSFSAFFSPLSFSLLKAYVKESWISFQLTSLGKKAFWVACVKTIKDPGKGEPLLCISNFSSCWSGWPQWAPGCSSWRYSQQMAFISVLTVFLQKIAFYWALHCCFVFTFLFWGVVCFCNQQHFSVLKANSVDNQGAGTFLWRLRKTPHIHPPPSPPGNALSLGSVLTGPGNLWSASSPIRARNDVWEFTEMLIDLALETR